MDSAKSDEEEGGEAEDDERMEDAALFVCVCGKPLGNWPEGEAEAGIEQGMLPELKGAAFFAEVICDSLTNRHVLKWIYRRFFDGTP